MIDRFLPFRQVHLDFHTSGQIPGVGDAFDARQFASTLENAHVQSVTCFARCHHGWIYYDTLLNPERRHPGLSRNLLSEQIEACHARGIRVPVYTTVQWDQFTAREHPEWRVVTADGRMEGTPPFEAGFYRSLCLNSPYRDFLKRHVAEILSLLPVDGLFLDIVIPVECVCGYCREEMSRKGRDPEDPEARRLTAIETVNDFAVDMSTFIRARNPSCSIFYNAGHVGPRHKGIVGAYSHLELETLPSGGWGYLHFPATARYARTLGIDYLGQTGKFHSTWGDFHSFKNPAALRYECFRMLALGAKCMIGDQLSPSGKIDQYVYELIGGVFEEVQRKEPWYAAEPVTEIGVMTPEEFSDASAGKLPPALRGAVRMLEEGAHQFDVLDSGSELSRYSLIVLPDDIPMSDSLVSRLQDYIEGGGNVIASFASGFDVQRAEVRLPGLGILSQTGSLDERSRAALGQRFERNDFAEYVRPRTALGAGLYDTEYVMYMKGMPVSVLPGTEILADGVGSWFDRDYRHFCSHLQTPSSGRPAPPAATRSGRCIYFSHPIFRQYDQNAPLWCKRLLLNAITLLLGDQLVRHDGPSTLQINIGSQKEQGRWVVHLLHYIPERRGAEFDVIEDVIPLHDVGFP